MHEVADTLRDLGVDPVTAEATAARLGWLSDQNLCELTENGGAPADFRQVLELLRRRESDSG